MSQRNTFLNLSLTQIIGGSLAAATAAFLGSRAGVVGTILGASMASVISAVAGAAYTESLRRTSALVRQRALVRTGNTTTLATVSEPGSGVASESDQDPTDTAELPAIAPEPTDDEAAPRRLRWGPIAAAALVVFALTAGIVTGMELITGRSLDGTRGTTVEQVVAPEPQPTMPAPIEPTVVPTPGVPTPSAPTMAPTPTPTPTESETPEPTPTPTPDADPTPTPQP